MTFAHEALPAPSGAAMPDEGSRPARVRPPSAPRLPATRPASPDAGPGASPNTEETRGRRWLPIRVKVLAALSLLLMAAVGTYLYLATSLFTQDKLAYVYDLQSALVQHHAEQTGSTIALDVERARLLAREAGRTDLSQAEREILLARHFAAEPDLLRVQVYRHLGDGRGMWLEQSFENAPALQEMGLSREDLARADELRPVPLDAVARAPDEVHVRNASLPPDAAVLTVAAALEDELHAGVVVADIKPERLLRLYDSTLVHTTFLVDRLGTVIAHPDANKVIDQANLSEHPLVEAARANPMGSGAREFEAADGTACLGAYADVGVAGLTVLTQTPRSQALRASNELVERSMMFGAAILLASFLASILFSRLLTAPVAKLRAATSAIGAGRFDVPIEVSSRDEIGDLAFDFRRMIKALKAAQAQLVHSEKMAAFGQLGAGITHEVKNPLTAIVGFAQAAKMRIDRPEKVTEYLGHIETQGRRSVEILQNFLKFARNEKPEESRIDLNEVVAGAVKLFQHQLNVNNVAVRVDLGDDVPQIMANEGELQQVMANLAINAQHAMPGGGTFSLVTYRDADGSAVLLVGDDGCGIPGEKKARIFEPFFTTKPPGEGTGLGLSIVYGIITQHKGKISVESEVGAGTTFEIRFPEAAQLDEKVSAG